MNEENCRNNQKFISRQATHGGKKKLYTRKKKKKKKTFAESRTSRQPHAAGGLTGWLTGRHLPCPSYAADAGIRMRGGSSEAAARRNDRAGKTTKGKGKRAARPAGHQGTTDEVSWRCACGLCMHNNDRRTMAPPRPSHSRHANLISHRHTNAAAHRPTLRRDPPQPQHPPRALRAPAHREGARRGAMPARARPLATPQQPKPRRRRRFLRPSPA